MDIWLAAWHLDDTKSLDKQWTRNDGWGIFLSRFLPDGSKYLYKCGNIFYVGFSAKTILESIKVGQKPEPMDRKSTGQPSQIRFNFQCCAKDCRASKQWIWRDAQKINKDDAASEFKLSDYEAIFDQVAMKSATGHEHNICSQQSSLKLDYSPYDPIIRFDRNKAVPDPENAWKRCDFNLLKELSPDKTPDVNLLRQTEAVTIGSAKHGAGLPTQGVDAHRLKMVRTHGGEYLTQPIYQKTLSQEKSELYIKNSHSVVCRELRKFTLTFVQVTLHAKDQLLMCTFIKDNGGLRAI